MPFRVDYMPFRRYVLKSYPTPGRAERQGRRYGNRDIVLHFAKNRRGREGFEIPLWFEGGFMRFLERESVLVEDQTTELDPYPELQRR